jgi:hypothetical protein
MVDDFVMDAVGQRKAPMDVHDAARFTAPGIWAHESALSGGVKLEIPSFNPLF